MVASVELVRCIRVLYRRIRLRLLDIVARLIISSSVRMCSLIIAQQCDMLYVCSIRIRIISRICMFRCTFLVHHCAMNMRRLLLRFRAMCCIVGVRVPRVLFRIRSMIRVRSMRSRMLCVV